MPFKEFCVILPGIPNYLVPHGKNQPVTLPGGAREMGFVALADKGEPPTLSVPETWYGQDPRFGPVKPTGLGRKEACSSLCTPKRGHSGRVLPVAS